jgi:hypothetical protein
LRCAAHPGYAGVGVPREIHHFRGRQRLVRLASAGCPFPLLAGAGEASKQGSKATPAKALGASWSGLGGVTAGGETLSSLHQAVSSRGCAFGLAVACGVKGNGVRLAARRLSPP